MAGRPKGSGNKVKKTTKQQVAKVVDDNIKIACSRCNALKSKKDFYMSYNNPMQPNGRVPYCKDCLKKMIVDDNGDVIVEKVQNALQKIDRPFIYDLWTTSIGTNADGFGTYIKNLAMPQAKYLTWKDSIFLPEINIPLNYNNPNVSKSASLSLKKNDFVLTDHIIDKWGFGYTDDEYYYFEKKWTKLIDNYGEKTSFHLEGLTTYIRFRVKEELATARGDIKESKEWGTMAKDAATAAKLNVSQLSKSDIGGGIELLPQLFEAVESKVGIISILPKLKEQPMDDADLIIWCIINYNRRLEDKPRIAYRDIWDFYDEMLNEYYKNQGYSKDDIQKEKNKRNSIFRDLGKVYIEPVYEEGE